MIGAQILEIRTNDHSKQMIIIEPVLERLGNGEAATGSYKIYKSYIYNRSELFSGKPLIKYKNDDLPDEQNPDYLGKFTIGATGEWHYLGNLLNEEEQLQLAQHVREFISS